MRGVWRNVQSGQVSTVRSVSGEAAQIAEHRVDERKAGETVTREEDQNAEANEFAMRLLVPDSLLAKENLDIDLTSNHDIEELARKYAVSVPVMLIRIGQFKRKQ